MHGSVTCTSLHTQTNNTRSLKILQSSQKFVWELLHIHIPHCCVAYRHSSSSTIWQTSVRKCSTTRGALNFCFLLCSLIFIIIIIIFFWLIRPSIGKFEFKTLRNAATAPFFFFFIFISKLSCFHLAGNSRILPLACCKWASTPTPAKSRRCLRRPSSSLAARPHSRLAFAFDLHLFLFVLFSISRNLFHWDFWVFTMLLFLLAFSKGSFFAIHVEKLESGPIFTSLILASPCNLRAGCCSDPQPGVHLQRCCTERDQLALVRQDQPSDAIRYGEWRAKQIFGNIWFYIHLFWFWLASAVFVVVRGANITSQQNVGSIWFDFTLILWSLNVKVKKFQPSQERFNSGWNFVIVLVVTHCVVPTRSVLMFSYFSSPHSTDHLDDHHAVQRVVDQPRRLPQGDNEEAGQRRKAVWDQRQHPQESSRFGREFIPPQNVRIRQKIYG